MFNTTFDAAKQTNVSSANTTPPSRDVGQAGNYQGKDGGAGPYIPFRKRKQQKQEKSEKRNPDGHINFIA